MQTKTLLFLTLMLATSLLIANVNASCNACGPYGIACISETSFQLCFNGERDKTHDYDCPAGTICTALALRCADRTSSAKAECSSSGCGVCDDTKMFTCTSRTTYVQCNGTATMPATAGNCPAGYTCDSIQEEICVPDCKVPENLECSNDRPV